jgi:hypothetical protein
MRKVYQKILARITFLIIIIFNITSTFSQSGAIKGLVIDKNTNEPLAEANVYFQKSGCGTITDKDGFFKLNCPSVDENDSLVVHYIVFKDFKSSSKIFLEPQSIESKDKVIVYGDQINISKYDIPQSVKIFQLDDISRNSSSDITSLLKPLPSINIEGNDLDGKIIQIRGSDADEVNVYIDGILINNLQFNNAADLSLIPAESIEKLEIINGGNSPLQGSGAFGGIINITTKQSTKTSLYLKGILGNFESLKGILGNIKSRSITGHIGLPLSNQVILNYFGQVSGFNPEIEYFPSEKYSNKTTNPEITTSKQNHHLSLNYFTKNGQLSGRFLSYFYKYSKPFWSSEYNNYLSALTYQGSIIGINNLDININHFYSDDQIKRTPDTTNSYVSTFKSHRVNARLAKRLDYKSTDLQLLIEYFHDELENETKEIYLSQEARLYHASIYDNRLSFAAVLNLNDSPKQNPNLTYNFYVGGRSDFFANGDNYLTNMIGIKFDYNLDHWNILPFINYGQNIKHPTLLESAYLINIEDITSADSIITHTESEFSTSGDLGVSFTYNPNSRWYRNMEMSFSLFIRTIYNKLLRRPFDNLIIQIPEGRNETRGFEGSIQLNDILNHFTINASYITLSLDNPLPNSFKPEEKMSLNLNYNSVSGLFFNTTIFHEGRSIAWYFNENNEILIEEFNPFNDMDMFFGVHFPYNKVQIRLQASIYNMFNNSNFRYYYLKKRHVEFSLSFSY